MNELLYARLVNCEKFVCEGGRRQNEIENHSAMLVESVIFNFKNNLMDVMTLELMIKFPMESSGDKERTDDGEVDEWMEKEIAEYLDSLHSYE